MTKVKISVRMNSGKEYSVEEDVSVDRPMDSPYGPKKTPFSVAMQAVTLMYNDQPDIVSKSKDIVHWSVDLDSDGDVSKTEGSSTQWWRVERDIAHNVKF